MDLAIGSDGYHPTEIDHFFAFRNVFFFFFFFFGSHLMLAQLRIRVSQTIGGISVGLIPVLLPTSTDRIRIQYLLLI